MALEFEGPPFICKEAACNASFRTIEERYRHVTVHYARVRKTPLNSIKRKSNKSSKVKNVIVLSDSDDEQHQVKKSRGTKATALTTKSLLAPIKATASTTTKATSTQIKANASTTTATATTAATNAVNSNRSKALKVKICEWQQHIQDALDAQQGPTPGSKLLDSSDLNKSCRGVFKDELSLVVHYLTAHVADMQKRHRFPTCKVTDCGMALITPQKQVSHMQDCHPELDTEGDHNSDSYNNNTDENSGSNRNIMAEDIGKFFSFSQRKLKK